ncbi:MAG: FKBP-type peptidyl-prolyl cis-trans isomerase [Thermoanaerobaculia bacterium]|nr:FKBP-type peptidyl-prolyl cis-trans isomerase [Thermoanaerobaculia bacterium]
MFQLADRRMFAVLVLTTFLALTFTGAATAQEMTEDEKTLYALGVLVSKNLGSFALTEAELATVTKGLSDGVLGKELAVDLQAYGPKVQQMAQARTEAAASKNRAAADAFVVKKAAEAGAEQTDSGLVFKTITAGDGASPSASDRVTVHYHGTLSDGTVFDSSVDRGQPATFGLTQVVPCWTEGLQKMKAGGKAELTCPPDLAYGAQGRPPTIPPASALVFEVELISIGD